MECQGVGAENVVCFGLDDIRIRFQAGKYFSLAPTIVQDTASHPGIQAQD